jgi:nitrite reductase (NO-forming)
MRAHCITYLAAILTGLIVAIPCRAEADLKLPRESVTLVAPPFVHAHEQVAKSGPKIIEFKMTVVEKPIVIDEAGTTIPGLTYNGSMEPFTVPDPRRWVVHQFEASLS